MNDNSYKVIEVDINEILPNIVKNNLIQIEKDDIKAIFDYLFGYKRNFKVDYEYVFDIQIVAAPIKETIVKKTIIGGNLILSDWDITSKVNEV